MKMPPPEKMPPNGNGRSPPNGRADELSHGERIAQLEVLIQNCATKTDLERLRTEMAELRTEMAEFKGEMKAEIAEVNGRIDTLRHEIKTDIARLETRIESFRADMTEKMNTMLRWIVGSMGTMIIAVLSLLAAFLFRLP